MRFNERRATVKASFASRSGRACILSCHVVRGKEKTLCCGRPSFQKSSRRKSSKPKTILPFLTRQDKCYFVTAGLPSRSACAEKGTCNIFSKNQATSLRQGFRPKVANTHTHTHTHTHAIDLAVSYNEKIRRYFVTAGCPSISALRLASGFRGGDGLKGFTVGG